MNNVNLVGRLAQDPETRDTRSGSVTNLLLVTDRPRIREGKVEKDENGYPIKDAEFHRITAFNGMGAAVAKHKAKGDTLAVTGRIHYSSYTDNEGVKRYSCEIIASNVDFI